MFYLKRIAVIVMFISLASTCGADPVHQKIAEGLKKLVPNMDISSIELSPVPGIYQVIVGPDVLFVSEDGRFIFNGDLYDVKAKENMTETLKSGVRKEMLAELAAEDYIEFAPKSPSHTIYVFTDITCGYCRKMHSQIDDINDLGIAVRYLAYPRSGPGTPSADELAAVWCAKDRKSAMSEAKAGNPQPYDFCMSPVTKHYELGGKFGVRGTPASYLDNGAALPGYLPPDKIVNENSGIGENLVEIIVHSSMKLRS